MRRYPATRFPTAQPGLTLIELMIVLVLLGILTIIAYPNYRDMAARATRNEAKAALLQIAAQQERWYLNNNTYTTQMTNLGYDVDTNFITDSGSYEVNVTFADTNNFSATAVYQQSDAEAGKCLTFRLDGRGERTSAPLPDCWTRTR